MKITIPTIEEQLRRFKRAYSTGARVNDSVILQQATDYYEFLSGFDEHLFKTACEWWLAANDNKMPNAIQLARACQKIVDSRAAQNDELPLNELVCQYTQYFMQKGFDLSLAEVKLCQYPNFEVIKDKDSVEMQSNAVYSKKYYGMILCPLHQNLAKAKHNPDSIEAIQIKDLLRFY